MQRPFIEQYKLLCVLSERKQIASKHRYRSSLVIPCFTGKQSVRLYICLVFTPQPLQVKYSSLFCPLLIQYRCSITRHPFELFRSSCIDFFLESLYNFAWNTILPRIIGKVFAELIIWITPVLTIPCVLRHQCQCPSHLVVLTGCAS